MDKIKEIMTYKSGKFTFNSKIDFDRILKDFIKYLTLYGNVKDIPILPDLASKLEEELIKKSIFSTAAIEGNPLSEEKVDEIISNETDKAVIVRAEQEIKNLKHAYNFVKNLPEFKKGFDLTEDFIKQVHKIITANIKDSENIPGEYRNHKVIVGDKNHGGIYTPPKISDDIKMLMKEFILWINNISKNDRIASDPVFKAALAHYYIGLIHPFSDGNGRTARLIEAIILKSNGVKYAPVMLSNYYYKNIEEYFLIFSQTRKNNDITLFIEFVIKGLIESLTNIKNKINVFIIVLILKEYFKKLKEKKILNRRQYEFLILLLDSDKTVDINDLYNETVFKILYDKVSQRTARRDIQKLLQKQLIIKNKEDKYQINFDLLKH